MNGLSSGLAHSGLPQHPLRSLNANIGCLVANECGFALKSYEASHNLCASFYANCPRDEQFTDLKSFIAESIDSNYRNHPFSFARHVKAADEVHICEDCKKLVTDIKLYLASNKTEQEIASILKEKICDPISIDFRKFCDSFIDANIGMIIRTLEDQIDPIQNSFDKCAIIGVCSPRVKISSLLRELTSPSSAPALNKQPIDGAVCDDCVKLVTDIETQVFNNATLNDIVNKISDIACRTCPARQNCHDFVLAHLKALVDLIRVHIEPQPICTVIGLCPISISDQLSNVLISRVLTIPVFSPRSVGIDESSPETCRFCTAFVKDISNNLIKNATTSELVSETTNVFCRNLPRPYEALCEKMVSIHMPPLITLIESKLQPEEVCEAIEICDTRIPPVQLEIARRLEFMQQMVELENQIQCGRGDCGKPVEEQKATCQECVQVLDDIRTKVETQEFNQKLKDIMINQVCPKAGFFTYECKLAINRYWEKLFEVLKSVSPKDACGFFELCPHLTNQEIFNPQTLLTILERFALEERNQVAALKNTNSNDDVPGLCQACEIIIHEIMNLAGGNMTAEAIETALREVCELVPKVDKAYCLEFVDKYAVKIIDALVSGATPKIACAALGFCTPIETDYPLVPSAVVSDPVRTDELDECTLCKLVIQYLYSKVNSSDSRETIKVELESVCSYLPEMFQTDCKIFVDQYSDVIVEMVMKEYTPEQVCSKIKLCYSSLKRLDKPAFHWPGLLNPTPKDNIECTECKFIVNFMYTQLKDNKTIMKIEEVLEKICDYLPGSIAKKCDKMIDDYFVTLVRLIELETSPEDICKALGFCESAQTTTQKPNDFVCDECAAIMTTAYDKLIQNNTEQQIEKVLDTLCDYVPKQNKNTFIVQEYTPKLIELLLAQETPVDICKILGLCNSGRIPSPLANPCKPASPQELCASRTLAAKCGVSYYCENLIWNKQLGQVNCSDQKYETTPHCVKQIYTEWNKLAETLLHRDNALSCQEGPSVFCKSVVSAKNCGSSSYKHCYHTVWRNQITKSTPECRSKAWACSSEERAFECGRIMECFSPPNPITSYLQQPECLSADTWCKDQQTQKRCFSQKYCAKKIVMPTTNESKICLGGPLSWCKNSNTAELCGKVEFCKDFNNDQTQRLSKQTDILLNPILGSQDCSQGPSYWCQNVKIAEQCKMKAWCIAKGHLKDVSSTFTPGWVQEQNGQTVEKPIEKHPECFWGPQFWCKSFEVAKSCGEKALLFCLDSVWSESGTKTSTTQKPGQDDCVNGPKYWCKDKETAALCDAMVYCNQFVWYESDSIVPEPEVTVTTTIEPEIDPECKKDASNLCDNEQLARKCNVLKFCQDFIWRIQNASSEASSNETITSTGGKCDLGPSYWCLSAKTARTCKKLVYCLEYVWKVDKGL
ncbi:hypothetical protein Ciccas_002954 [Cichlidogyrus casuarinus]|uniref:Saposin n=1 Tax=Cichlidogyrus casuarinus TaxID=1844966 RepID=A0ABD2QFR9_9PLAT